MISIDMSKIVRRFDCDDAGRSELNVLAVSAMLRVYSAIMVDGAMPKIGVSGVSHVTIVRSPAPEGESTEAAPEAVATTVDDAIGVE